MAQLISSAYRASAREASQDRLVPDRTAKLAMRTKTYEADSVSECLQLAKNELGVEAMILSKRSFRKGAFFGRFGGRERVEISFGTYRPAPAGPDGSASIVFSHGALASENDDDRSDNVPREKVNRLENQISGLANTVQMLMENGGRLAKKPGKMLGTIDSFISQPVEAEQLPLGVNAHAADLNVIPEPKANRRLRSRSAAADPPALDTCYASLIRQLIEAEVAEPLARQLVAEIPIGQTGSEAVSVLRTIIAGRLLIANRIRTQPGNEMKIFAFIGTTGVGKTTTVAKLAAQYAILERRKVGIITMDTYRIAAASQLQTYGQILKVPVLVSNNQLEFHSHLAEFKKQGMELVLVDTAGRSPNEMMPLGETMQMFDGLGPVTKFLAISATLDLRDMERVTTRFQSLLAPDAMVMTKLDEAADNACFGKLLTVQAKYGLPLAYVTTGQKVPDDITFPDPHVIATRLLTTAFV